MSELLKSLCGPVWPKGVDGGHNNSRVDLIESIISQTKAVHISGMKGLDDEVSGLGQLLENFLTPGRFDIQGYATFASIKIHPVEAFFGVGYILIKGADISARVSSRLFDLEHTGSEVGEELGAEVAFFISQIQDSIRTKQCFFLILPNHNSTSP